MNQYLVDRIQNIPAEQVKEAVVSWLATGEAELNNLEQHLGLATDTSNNVQLNSFLDIYDRGLPLH